MASLVLSEYLKENFEDIVRTNINYIGLGYTGAVTNNPASLNSDLSYLLAGDVGILKISWAPNVLSTKNTIKYPPTLMFNYQGKYSGDGFVQQKPNYYFLYKVTGDNQANQLNANNYLGNTYYRYIRIDRSNVPSQNPTEDGVIHLRKFTISFVGKTEY